jgi:hypothetical protein
MHLLPRPLLLLLTPATVAALSSISRNGKTDSTALLNTTRSNHNLTSITSAKTEKSLNRISIALIATGLILGFVLISILTVCLDKNLGRWCDSWKKRKKRKKTRRGVKVTMSKLPRDRRISTDSETWGLVQGAQSPAATTRENFKTGREKDEMERDLNSVYVYQEVPTEEKKCAGYPPKSRNSSTFGR